MPSRAGRASRQQARVALQAGSELLGPERRAPRRGQLDGQRHAIQPGAHLGDRGRVIRGQRERGARRAGPANEQAAGLGPGDRTDRTILRHAQRRHGEDQFARHIQAFPAGGHDPHPAALPGQHHHYPAGRSQDMLAVVEHDQQLAVGQRPRDARHRVRRILFRNPQCLGDGCGNEPGIGERGQLDHPRTVLEAVAGQRRCPQGQAGLAAASRAGQRHYAGGLKAVQDGGELRSSSHQRAHLGGQAAVPLGLAFRLHTPGAHHSPITRPGTLYDLHEREVPRPADVDRDAARHSCVTGT